MLYGYTFYSLCCIQDEQEKDLCIRLSKEHPKEKVDHTDITSTKNCICPDCQCIVRAFGKFIDLPSLLDQQSLYTREHLEIVLKNIPQKIYSSVIQLQLRKNR